MASSPRDPPVNRALRVVSDADAPILVSGGEHICHARQITPVSAAVDPDVCLCRTRLYSESNTSYSIDPDACLTEIMSDMFRELYNDFDDVFDITKPPLYSGASGKIHAFVNMNPMLPPQRKGRHPQYDRSTLNRSRGYRVESMH